MVKTVSILSLFMACLVFQVSAGPIPGTGTNVPVFGGQDFGYFIDIREDAGCLSFMELFRPVFPVPYSAPYFVRANESFRLLMHLSAGNSALAGPQAPGVIKPYDPGLLTGDPVNVDFSSGFIRGIPFNNSFCLQGSDRPALNANFISIGAASTPYLGYDNYYDGLASMAYTSLSKPDGSTPGLMDSMVSQWGVADQFTLHLCRHRYDLYQEEGWSCNLVDNPQGGVLVLGEDSLPDDFHPNHPQMSACNIEDEENRKRYVLTDDKGAVHHRIVRTVAESVNRDLLLGRQKYQTKVSTVTPPEGHQLQQIHLSTGMGGQRVPGDQSEPPTADDWKDHIFYTGIEKEKFYEILIAGMTVGDQPVTTGCQALISRKPLLIPEQPAYGCRRKCTTQSGR